MPELELVGIGCHIGSLLADAAPFVAAAERLGELVDRLAAGGVRLRHIDVGGGIGIRYREGEAPQPIGAFVRGVLAALGPRPQRLILDPGRSIVGNAGVLLTRVEYVKPGAARNFLVVDAAMNDLIRPPLYSAWHEVRNVRASAAADTLYDVVGPVCESADFLARDRRLALQGGDLLAVMCAGAYGMAMSSNYNSRPRPAEVLVEGANARVVRERETVEQLFAAERVFH
jgi:diaminopimelate decarboxylase